MYKKILSVFIVVLLFSNAVMARTSTVAIDTPTNVFYATNEYSLNFLVYKEGGTLFGVDFGVKPGFNLGFSLDFYKMISDESMKTRPPRISAKLRLYKGNIYWPAATIGYSGQGYGLYENGRYETEERGLYLLLERELWLPDLIWNFGVNMRDFENSELYGFLNVRYMIKDRFMVVLEYDNIRSTPNNRLNIGFRYSINNDLSMGLGVRKLNDINDGLERVLQITYVSTFNFFE